MRGRSTRFVYFLVILGLITAGISPACKFIGGKTSLVEICTPFGLQKVTIEDKSKQESDKSAPSGKTCAFCLAAHTHKAFQALAPVLVTYAPRKSEAPSFLYQTPVSAPPHRHSARGPPLFS